MLDENTLLDLILILSQYGRADLCLLAELHYFRWI